MLGFIVLAHRATTDEVADESIVTGREEGGMETLQSPLHPFMPMPWVCSNTYGQAVAVAEIKRRPCGPPCRPPVPTLSQPSQLLFLCAW
jgi:hypothetical protein